MKLRKTFKPCTGKRRKKKLHRQLDGVKPRVRAQAGAATSMPTLQAGAWKLDVDDEKSVGLVGRPLSKGVLEFFSDLGAAHVSCHALALCRGHARSRPAGSGGDVGS